MLRECDVLQVKSLLIASTSFKTVIVRPTEIMTALTPVNMRSQCESAIPPSPPNVIDYSQVTEDEHSRKSNLPRVARFDPPDPR